LRTVERGGIGFGLRVGHEQETLAQLNRYRLELRVL
jgi:hypothetical protein